MLLVFFVLYFFLFPFTVKEEYVLVPEKGTSLAQESVPDEGISGNWPYRSFGAMGYYDEENTSFNRLPGGGRSRVSDRFYIEDREETLRLVSKTGVFSTEIDSSLVPVFSGEHIFLTDYSLGYIREIDTAGRTLWEYYMPSVITCLDNQSGITAAGLLNGEIILLGEEGKLLYRWSPGGSRISAIYGIALSPSGERLAVVSGIDPQRFILIERKENGFRPVYHENLARSFRKPLKLIFNDSSHLIIEGGDKGLCFTPGNPVLTEFSLQGEFRDGRSIPRDGTLLFQSETDGHGVLSLYTKEGERILENRYNDRPYSLDVRGDRILLTGEKGAYVLRREFY